MEAKDRSLELARLATGSHASHFVVRLKLFFSKPSTVQFSHLENFFFFLNGIDFLESMSDV